MSDASRSATNGPEEEASELYDATYWRQRALDAEAAIAARSSTFLPERMRIRFDTARKQMRDAFAALGQGRMTYDEAQERFFDGNEELNDVWREYLLLLEIG